MRPQTKFLLREKQSCLFVGDSITDCGRITDFKPLGNGYVSQIRDLIAARYPKHNNVILNKGISGNTIRDLTNRWTDDVTNYQPDWISLKIGINDVHRWIENDVARSVSPDQFAEMYDALLNRTKKETDAKILLVTPFYLSREKHADSARMRVLKELPKYVKTVKQMSKVHNTLLVDLHDYFQKLLKHIPAEQLCPEPVHPNVHGHLAIAQAWLQTMRW